MNVLGTLTDILTHPQYANILGWIFAASILLGGFLREQRQKGVLNWIVVALFFIVFQEISRYFFVSVAHKDNLMFVEESTISLIAFLIDSIGVALGWIIVNLALERAKEKDGKTNG